MNFLFWFLLVIDLLLAIISIVGGLFRGNLHLQNVFTSFHFWGISLGLLAVAGGLVLRFSLKMPRLSLLVVAIPLLMVLVFYLLDKKVV